MGEWGKLQNEEFNGLYCSSNVIEFIKLRRMSCMGYVACMWEGRSIYRDLVVKPEGKRSLGTPRYRCEDNFKRDF
jgi:hypothetical protein